MSSPVRVLVVAHRTAAAPALLEAVRERAAAGPAAFTLLVPRTMSGLQRVLDPEDGPEDEAHAVLDLALPLLEQAVGAPVAGLIGDPDPVTAVQDAVNAQGFEEIVISTLSPRVSRWLHLDAPRRLQVLGLPITTVTARGATVVQPA